MKRREMLSLLLFARRILDFFFWTVACDMTPYHPLGTLPEQQTNGSLNLAFWPPFPIHKCGLFGKQTAGLPTIILDSSRRIRKPYCGGRSEAEKAHTHAGENPLSLHRRKWTRLPQNRTSTFAIHLHFQQLLQIMGNPQSKVNQSP